MFQQQPRGERAYCTPCATCSALSDGESKWCATGSCLRTECTLASGATGWQTKLFVAPGSWAGCVMLREHGGADVALTCRHVAFMTDATGERETASRVLRGESIAAGKAAWHPDADLSAYTTRAPYPQVFADLTERAVVVHGVTHGLIVGTDITLERMATAPRGDCDVAFYGIGGGTMRFDETSMVRGLPEVEWKISSARLSDLTDVVREETLCGRRLTVVAFGAKSGRMVGTLARWVADKALPTMQIEGLRMHKGDSGCPVFVQDPYSSMFLPFGMLVCFVRDPEPVQYAIPIDYALRAQCVHMEVRASTEN